MGAEQPTYYEVLGLTPSATAEEIKKRYRELARQYHPDVAHTPDAADKFKAINEANSILSDPQRRATYDAELRLKEARQRKSASGQETYRTSSRPAANASPSSSPSAQEHRRPRAATTATERAQPSGAKKAASDPLDEVIAAAQAAFRRLRYREAEAICREVLKRNNRRADAYELLGDILRARNRKEEAIAMYSYVLQLDPRNGEAQAKFDRLTGQPPRRQATKARTHARASDKSFEAQQTRIRVGLAARRMINLMGLGLFGFLFTMVGLERDPPAPSVLLYEWDPLILFALLVLGGLLGLLFSINGLVEPARQELEGHSTGSRSRWTMPLGAVLVAFALVWFYAALVVYCIIGFLQGKVSRSIMDAFWASFGIVALFALLRHENALHILLSGGNIVFLGLLAGWFFGDMLTYRGRVAR
jgi:tetratricopeptide (TPR) repeat protein